MSATTIPALLREWAAWIRSTQDLTIQPATLEDAADQIDALTARCATLEKDAARYRWAKRRESRFWDIVHFHEAYWDCAIDAAIDGREPTAAEFDAIGACLAGADDGVE